MKQLQFINFHVYSKFVKYLETIHLMFLDIFGMNIKFIDVMLNL